VVKVARISDQYCDKCIILSRTQQHAIIVHYVIVGHS